MAFNRAQECKEARAKAGTYGPMLAVANCYCDESIDYLVCASKAIHLMDAAETKAPGNGTVLQQRGPLMGDDSSKVPCGIDVRFEYCNHSQGNARHHYRPTQWKKLNRGCFSGGWYVVLYV